MTRRRRGVYGKSYHARLEPHTNESLGIFIVILRARSEDSDGAFMYIMP